jgi:ubiquinone/menaquinone biosynthesis C-methylase UbiE
VIEVAAPAGYRIWSASYDDTANPLLALEMRVLRKRLGPLSGCRLLDVAAGTGRWTGYAAEQGAQVTGVDLSPHMLAVAARKPSLAGRLAVADMRALPIADAAADLALCSFALSYVESVPATMAELARVARRVVVSDLHPTATAAGWSRSFRSGADVYSIRSYAHSFAEIENAATAAGLEKHWEVEASFGEPERQFFEAAGKGSQFSAAQQIPAIFVRCWGKP